MGRFEDAAALYPEVLELARTTGNGFIEALTTGHTGQLHLRQGDAVRARAAAQAAVHQLRTSGYPAAVGAFLGLLGEACAALGDRQAAQDSLAEGRAILEEVGDKHDLGLFWCRAGRAAAALGDPDGASAALHRATTLHAEGDRSATSTLALAIADLTAHLAQA